MENQTFPWSDWRAAVRQDPALSTAFTGHPRRVELRAGSLIGRFVTPMENRVLGPWWVPMSTLERIADRSAGTGGSVSGVARHALAVPHEWNRTMQSLLLYRVMAPYWAWLGRTAPQHARAAGGRGATFLGGEFQLYVPHLQAQHVASVGTALAHFSSPQSRFSN